MRTVSQNESCAKKKVYAVILAMLFIASSGIGLMAKFVSDNNSVPAPNIARPLGVMDPGGLPHYFGPYANYANSPVPRGSLVSVTLTSGGMGYTAPTATIYDYWGTGSGATASVTTSGGVITSIVLTKGGSGYSAPEVTINDPTGTGAAAYALVGGNLTGGIRKFIDSLPGLGPANANNLGNYLSIAIPDLTTFPGCDYYEIAVVKYTQKVHTDLPATEFQGYVQIETPAVAPYSKHIALTNPGGGAIHLPDGSQAYGVDKPSYLGPTIIATRDMPTRITFYNLLPTGTAGNLFIPVDSTVMGAGMGPLDMPGMPGMKENYTENRATLHLHGGATPWISDGTPHQWTTPAGENTQYPKGVSVEYVPDMWFVNSKVVPNTVGQITPPVSGATINPGPGMLTFYYTNNQSARLMFYHDHSYGITRLNVYAGEAAPYLLTDALDNKLINEGVIPSQTGEYMYGIPLVIQDKAFVDASTIAYQDPTWAWGSTPTTPHTGDLWAPHVYMPNQNPYDISGANPWGRWDYGPWFFPATAITQGPVPNPYYGQPGEPPMIPGVPRVSMGMEAFQDTPVVNGQAYPYLDVEPMSYRFRILNAANDRFFNLQMYVADPAVKTWDGRKYTEVKMVPALTNASYPANWPSDGRPGGVPDPALMGPSWVQIGTEGGFLPAPVVVPNQPVSWNNNMKTFNFGNVQDHSLVLGSAERADVIVDFSKYAGKTIILYNDAPAGFPAYDPRSDYFTGAADQTIGGGVPTPQVGYGPNTRTIMQFRVSNVSAAAPLDVNALKAKWMHTSNHLGVFEQDQDPIIVAQSAYNSAYGGSFPSLAYAMINDVSMTYSTIAGLTLTEQLEQRAIHDEMGGSYDPIYGRMSGSFGLEIPTGNAVTQMFIPVGFASPPVDIAIASATVSSPVPGDGTQIWKITHNGVDTHAVHFHLFTVQLINRVAWDNTLLVPDENELGWKETVRVDPLEATIVATRPVVPWLPWEVPSLIREIDPTMPDGAVLMGAPGGFINPAGVGVTVANHLVSYGWEYMMHCHLLEHEEMDMMHAMPIAVPPYSPSNLTGSMTGNNITLTWTDNSIAETGFWVQRANGTGPWVTIANVTFNLYSVTPTKGGSQSYTDTVVADGTVYNYRVYATTTVGDTVSTGYPHTTVGSVNPTNDISVDSSNGGVTVGPAPPPPPGGGPGLPPPPGPYTYVAPAPLVPPASSGLTTYTAHAPIRINSDADFTAANGVSGGSGTSASPYLIENLRINALGASYGIYIGNTTAHFLVRNNIIQNASGLSTSIPFAPDSGVVLYNVVNGAVAYNAISACAWAGVYMQNVQLVTVFNNSLTGCYYGVYLTGSGNNTIASNIIGGCSAGVWVSYSNSNWIDSNLINRNSVGIQAMASQGLTITLNSLYLNSYYGIIMHQSGYGYIHDNDLVANHGSTATRNATHVQAFDDSGTNRWDTGSRGNYWSDWASTSPYLIDGGAGAQDNFPLAALAIPNTLTTIVVTPSPIAVALHSNTLFTAQGLSQYGTVMTGITFTWTTNVGVMTANSLYANATIGTVGYVRATSGLISGDAVVTVSIGTLAMINVTPAAANVVAGGLMVFAAQGKDASYNNITGLVYNWTSNVGTVTTTGLFTATAPAGSSGFVNASVGAIVGSATVVITAGVMTHIVITPATANVTAGGSQLFTAIAYDSVNNVIPGAVFSWTTTAGSITSTGTFTASTIAGTAGYVRAASGSVVADACVYVVPGALNHVIVSPTPTSVVAGSSVQFTATGKDFYNNTIAGTAFTWSATVGPISASGLLTAQTLAGKTGFVNATSGLIVGSASVTVVASLPTHITITPATASVVAGGAQAFSAVGYDMYNNTVTGLVFAWSTNIGTMVGPNLTAQTVAGVMGYVMAISSSVTGVAFVTVVPAALNSITVAPTPITVAAGSQAQFWATGKDVYNNSIPGLVFTWTSTVGGITATGLFTAQTLSGVSGYVNASSGGKIGSASVSILATQSVTVVVTPATASVVAGGTQVFTAVAYDSMSNPLPGATFTWSTSVGTMTGGTLTATTLAGTSGYVRATYGTAFGMATVTIVPGALNHISLTPSSLSAAPGSVTQFSAAGKDLYNNTVSGLTFVWSSTIGSITVSGSWTAPLAGSGFVNATASAVTGSAPVSVAIGSLTRIVLTPSGGNVTAGTTLNFSAVGYDQYGSVLTGVVFSWTTNMGTMTGSLLTAQTLAGITGYVRATSGLIYADAFVTVVPGALSRIDVTPKPLSTTVGLQTQFTAVGKDVHGNAIAGLVYTWSTTAGTISVGGLYTAQASAGAGFVNATSGLVVGSANVTITAVVTSVLTRIVVSPGPATVVAGTHLNFTAAGFDQFNLQVPGLIFTWASNVGTMTGSNLTARTLAGTGTVTATTGSLSGSATVTVVAAALNHITVTPTPKLMLASTQVQFTATGMDVYNNTVAGVVFAWTTTVGTINASTGLLTAQATAGVGFVNATSGLIAGSAAVTVVVSNGAPLVTPLIPLSGTVGVAVSVTGNAVDPDGDPIRYSWSFGDLSPMVVLRNTTHIYTVSGTYTLTLHADDLTGLAGHNVSSSTTVTIPYVMSLLTGWNFVTIPVQGGTYTANTIGLSFGDTVVGWSPATQFYAQSFIVGITPSAADFALAPSTGYWIYVSAPRTISPTGNVPTALQSTAITVPVTGGWVAVGLASMKTTLTASSLVTMYTGGIVTSVVGWNAATQTYSAYLVGFPMNDFALAPGQAYWIYVTSSGTFAYIP